MAISATERSRVLRERRAHGKVVLTVVVGEDELAEIARAGYAEASSTDRKGREAADGSVVNSISPRGISGGAVFDGGNLADPDNLRPNAHMWRRLAAIVIEYHPEHNRIVTTRVRLILDFIAERLSTRVGGHVFDRG